MVANSSNELRLLYADHLAGSRRLLGRTPKIAADPARVTKAIDHALTYSRPKRLYVLDTVSQIEKMAIA
ncbi:hypothetical protein [Rhodococcus sp. EPR-157]|uniref:hypothetical protein n=1 Tax=Rhodococcus sp. EPR-157 TaxID=1813677 RepID=UPI0012E743AC|nr:hypothetical protein [Rhodococcus sp. EPR-157]